MISALLFSQFIGLFQLASELKANGTADTLKVIEVSENHYARAEVMIHSGSKSITALWTAKKGAGAALTTEKRSESVAYFPLAAARSRAEGSVLYVAGRQGSLSVLEKWDFGVPSLLIAMEPLVTENPPQTQMAPTTKLVLSPTSRTALPLDPSLGHISDIATNGWRGVGPGQEQVWVLEYETADVYSIDAVTGVATLVVDGQANQYRSLKVGQHSVYGTTCMLKKQPWFVHTLNGTPGMLDLKVYYDQNYDGVFDGDFLILFNGSWWDHPLYSTGEWLDL